MMCDGVVSVLHKGAPDWESRTRGRLVSPRKSLENFFRPLDNLVSKWNFKAYWSIEVSHSLILTQKRVVTCPTENPFHRVYYVIKYLFINN